MRGDVAAAFGLAGLGHSPGTYTATVTDRVEGAWQDGPEDLDWHGQAACHPRNRPPEVTPAEWTGQFFPPRGVRPWLVAEVVALCESCPVQADCDDFARRHREPGIWGGTTARARRRPGGKSWPTATRNEVNRLARLGLADAEIERRTAVPVRTVRMWRRNDGIHKHPGGRLVAPTEGAA